MPATPLLRALLTSMLNRGWLRAETVDGVVVIGRLTRLGEDTVTLRPYEPVGDITVALGTLADLAISDDVPF